MNPGKLTAAQAMRLAMRPEGTTANELADVAGCSLRAAQETLADLVRDGLLLVDVPTRKGRRLGDWRNIYRMAGEVGT